MSVRALFPALLVLVTALLQVGPLLAGPTKPVDFAHDVYPILKRACIECHGPQLQEADLRFDQRDSALSSSIVPGKPDESELVRRISLPKGHDEIMPARGEPLPPRDVQVIRRWIAEGAVWPEKLEPTTHWAYVKPARPALPEVKDTAWPQTPIDYFVLQRLEQEGLSPSPPADEATLLRRLSLDLIGLPPAPEEVDAFVQAARQDRQRAIKELVDRLLASPQFGERWARPWLDLARYADSHGFQRDDLRQLWPYRDWVIRALNEDMPFTRFTIEQIAGDLLDNVTEETRIATGFHRCTMTNVEAGSEPEETRTNQVIDRVNTTAAVWLGTTLECCQCHDHKYDPFTQTEYYRLLAFFNNTAIEADRTKPSVPGSIRFMGPEMTLSGMTNPDTLSLDAEIQSLKRDLTRRRNELSLDRQLWEKELIARLDSAPKTHVLSLEEFVSLEGSPFELLDDGSVRLVDDPPDTDTYRVTVRTQLKNITGFKLEALADPELPGNGPGRGDAQRPNFVLHEFTAAMAPADNSDKPKPVKLKAIAASFSQKNFDVSGAVDANAKTAWAINPKFGQPHWAVFSTAQPVGYEEGTCFTFTLEQNFGGGRTIGRLRLSALEGDVGGDAIPAEIVKILKTPEAKRSEKQIEALVEYRFQHDAEANRLRNKLADLEQDKPRPVTTLVMQELPEPRRTTVFFRGDYRTPGDTVQPGVPSVLHPLPEGPPNRLTLARWLVDRDNPLVARVTVNRYWAELFGRGLVSTVEDFGVKGEPPTHPELLDWLAMEFMDNGWSMKHVLRTIVLSATYQQSSKVSPQLLERDDQNLLYARGPRFRLDAETIRDNTLAVAGLLSLKQFGPPVRPYQPDGLWTKVGGTPLKYEVSPGEDQYRRGVYVVWKRASPYPSFVNFDATARLACTVKRSRSNTPLQALTLLNDPVYVEAAFALARRVLAEQAGASCAEQLRHAFRLCLSREPKQTELAVLQRLYEEQLAAAETNPAATKQLLADQPLGGRSPAEWAAWHAVATALLNLDETITKN